MKCVQDDIYIWLKPPLCTESDNDTQRHSFTGSYSITFSFFFFFFEQELFLVRGKMKIPQDQLTPNIFIIYAFIRKFNKD